MPYRTLRQTFHGSPVQRLACLTFTAGVFAAAPLSAQAYFQVHGVNPAAPTMVAVNTTSPYALAADTTPRYLEQVGTPDAVVAAHAGGQSDGVPYDTALKIVLPKNWQGYIRQGVSPAQMVRWKAATTWLDALTQAAMQTNTIVTVDWSRNSVYVDPLPGVTAMNNTETAGVYSPSVAPMHTDGMLTAISDSVSGGSHPYPEVHSWELRSGEMLSKSLERWTAEAGWTLQWTLGYDFPITVPASFTGDIYTAVSSLMASYRGAGQMTDAEAVFMKGNRVLVVRPWNRFSTDQGASAQSSFVTQQP